MSEEQDRSPIGWEAIADELTEYSHQLLEAVSTRSKRNAGLAQQGEYRMDHLLDDADWFWRALAESLQYAVKTAEAGLAAFMGMMQVFERSKAEPNPTNVSTTVSVPPTTELHPGAFRALGSGTDHWIQATDVKIQRDPTDLTQLTVTLSFANVSPFERSRTIVYEGHVHDATGVPVTDTIRIPKPAH
jgi:hypothetical protein